MTQNGTQSTLDDAVRHCVKENGDGSDVVTGWVLATSVKHPLFPDSDGYITQPNTAQASLTTPNSAC